jgi:alkanesulfonate monooxygenase SsuD/methylene tetrahydromethanopterin reductase-like flavin-dependent oxidoreductase (luciferase family)
MKVGVHLPLADLGEGVPDLEGLRRYVATAADLGFSTVAANDHLVWRRPWLDGPTALATVAHAAGQMTLATTITLPVVRHPAVVAKALSTLATLAPGRVVGGLGPGSSRADHDAVGVPFEERWARFDEALPLVRALVRGEPTPAGRFYSAATALAPLPDPPPQVWFGSWGSDRRIAAMAGAADGWFASAYNADPGQYAEARTRLDAHLRAQGRDPERFPDAVATAWCYVTDDARATEVVEELLAPLLGRDPETLRHLPVGSPARCAEALAAYAEAGAREVLLWPVHESLRQLERCAEVARVVAPG